MKWNRFGYYIKEGVGSIFNHGFMSFASVCIIIACLLIMGSFSLLAVNVDAIIGKLEDNNQVLAFVDEQMPESEARTLESQIRALDNVKSVTFVSRDQAMESYVKQYENTSLLEGLDSSVLRHRYVIYLDDIALMAQTQAQLADINGVAQVNAHLEISRGFIAVRNIVSIVSISLIAVLLVISLFIISNTIKLTTVERREEIAIMKMVGATSSFIRWPFVVEGLVLGLFGSCLAYLAQWGIYTVLANKFIANSGIEFIRFLPFGQMAVPIFVAFFGVGFGVGVVGSAMAIGKYLKV